MCCGTKICFSFAVSDAKLASWSLKPGNTYDHRWLICEKFLSSRSVVCLIDLEFPGFLKVKMASLQGLPPLPKSLRGLLQGGSEQWKETEKIHQMKTCIQQDLDSPEAVVANGEATADCVPGEVTTSPANGDTSEPGSGDKYPQGNTNLGSAISLLRREMIDLRQLDISLLCQLWTLSENIQEYKTAVHERFSETNSTCSSHSLDNYPESMQIIEENDFEDETFTPSKFRDSREVENIYENAHQHRRNVNPPNYYDRIRTPEIKPPVISPINESNITDELYEPMYLQPVPSPYREVVIPVKRSSSTSSTSSRSSQSPGSQKITWTSYPYTGQNTTYESTC